MQIWTLLITGTVYLQLELKIQKTRRRTREFMDEIVKFNASKTQQ